MSDKSDKSDKKNECPIYGTHVHGVFGLSTDRAPCPCGKPWSGQRDARSEPMWSPYP